jgi:hypothetical protein
MGFNANFTGAVLVGAQVVVTGRSQPGSDLPLSVTMVHKGDLLTRAVPATSDDWAITFPAGEQPYKVGDEVHLTGVAIRPGTDEPFVWPGNFEIAPAP